MTKAILEAVVNGEVVRVRLTRLQSETLNTRIERTRSDGRWEFVGDSVYSVDRMLELYHAVGFIRME